MANTKEAHTRFAIYMANALMTMNLRLVGLTRGFLSDPTRDIKEALVAIARAIQSDLDIRLKADIQVLHAKMLEAQVTEVDAMSASDEMKASLRTFNLGLTELIGKKYNTWFLTGSMQVPLQPRRTPANIPVSHIPQPLHQGTLVAGW